MRNLRKFLAAALLAALPAPALAQDMCAALDRIAAAAREPAPFASLLGAAATGAVLVPGFRPGSCRVRVGDGVSCSRNLAPASLALPAMEAAMRSCLGTGPVEPPPGRGAFRHRDLVFVAAGVRYEMSTSCEPRCRAGMIASFRVTLAGGGARPSANFRLAGGSSRR